MMFGRALIHREVPAMITSGIDIGAKNIKVVIIKDGNVVSKAV